MSEDKIEKQIVLRASRERVWKAITDSAEFGRWFGMKVDGPFLKGGWVHASIAPTQVDPEVAEMQKEYEGVAFELFVEAIEPQDLFSYRWHPYEYDEGQDHLTSPSTLVEFALSEVPEGVLLKITESGFDSVPAAKRAKAFSSNEQGWVIQIQLIEKYLNQVGE